MCCRTGDGLTVRWRVADVESSYSRMIGGSNSTCVFLDTAANQRYWVKAGCDRQAYAACVKRDCRMA